MKGVFVAFEGIDASGKATQSKILSSRLDAELYSFPAYQTRAGRLIAAHLQSEWAARALLLQEGKLTTEETKTLDAMVLQSLMLTNRMELAVGIRDHLKNEKSVVCDRYWCSGYAYGRADGIDGDYLLQIHDLLPKPHVQILIDIDPADSVSRRPERRDRYEKQEGLMEAVSKNYRELWTKMSAIAPAAWVMVDGRRPVEEVTEQVWKAVGNAYGRHHMAPPERRTGS